MIAREENTTTRIVQNLAAILLGATVTSCGVPGGGAEPVDANAPSVTYKYRNDEELIDAMLKAEKYCLQFNSWPTASVKHPQPDSEVTFICEHSRAVLEADRQTRALPSQPTVSYSYHDQQSLIDATKQAQRHCAEYGAQVRSTEITHVDGDSTVVFECVR